MLTFFTLAVLLVVIALGILLPGLFLDRPVVTAGRDTKNITIAKERLAEIEADLERGIISGEKYGTLREEIERNLVDDLAGEPTLSEASRGGQWAAVAIAFVLPVLAAGIYLVIGTPSAVNLTSNVIASTSQDMPGSDDIPGMIASLATRLEISPDDAEGWALLGRSYMTTGQYELAVTAYDKLLNLTGEHPLILLMLADALTMSAEGRVPDRARELIQRTLVLDPDNPQGLWMGGIAAIQGGNPRQAIGYWQRLEPMLSDNPEQQAEIKSLLENANKLVSSEGVASPAGSKPLPVPSKDKSIAVRVDVNAAFLDQVDADDTVFIYARAAEGPPMPLAVERITVAELPTEVVLDDGDAMTPAFALSGFDRVIVGARISRSGDAIAQPGDIEGLSGEVVPGKSGVVTITMDHVVE